jgi:hypothetical protein
MVPRPQRTKQRRAQWLALWGSLILFAGWLVWSIFFVTVGEPPPAGPGATATSEIPTPVPSPSGG